LTPSGGHVARRADIAVEIRDLCKTFPTRGQQLDALHDVSFTIRRDEFLTVVGPSGCGKTTLLNILADLETPTAGSVRFNFAGLHRPLRSVVFQEQSVFPWLTVLENAAFGLMARGVPSAERETIARRVLARTGLSDFEHAYPHQLSGGMRQRVNLARAFANDPAVLLMDEPFASLDEQTKLLQQDDLLRLWEGDGEQARKTVVFITHSLDEAIRLADRIVVMTARPGRVKTIVTVDLPRPRDVFALQADPAFLGLRSTVWEALKEEVLAARDAAQSN
jgi:NitT/TauT family transport system ATP-binding protein